MLDWEFDGCYVTRMHDIAGDGGSRTVGATWPKPPFTAAGSSYTVKKPRRGRNIWSRTTGTHLENRFRMRPAGVTSKKDMGDLKMAVAIFSCNLRDAYANHM